MFAKYINTLIGVGNNDKENASVKSVAQVSDYKGFSQ
jgi:hypothetical protein